MLLSERSAVLDPPRIGQVLMPLAGNPIPSPLGTPTPAPPAAPAAEDLIFPVLLADPPWRYDFSKSKTRAIENQYPTMELAEIMALPVQLWAADAAVLYLWATAPKLPEALAVMNAWGFTYKTNMVWVKHCIGMGYWARGRHEHILIGTKGNFPAPAAPDRPDSVIEAPRRKHSAKPHELYEVLELAYPDLPKLEIFARARREGWQAWGNECNTIGSATT